MTMDISLIEPMNDEELAECARLVELSLQSGAPQSAALWALRSASLLNTVKSLQAENLKMREALAGASSWLDRWAVHAGNCRGASTCTCGLTFIRFEVGAAHD